MDKKDIEKLADSCRTTSVGNAFSVFRRKILDTGLEFTEDEIVNLYNYLKMKRSRDKEFK